MRSSLSRIDRPARSPYASRKLLTKAVAAVWTIGGSSFFLPAAAAAAAEGVEGGPIDLGVLVQSGSTHVIMAVFIF